MNGNMVRVVKWVLILIAIAFFIASVVGYHGTHAQDKPNSWLIWRQPDMQVDFYGQAFLYKIQDGDCSVYVAWSAHGSYSGSTVSVSTGQGCK